MRNDFSAWISHFSSTDSNEFGCYHPQDMQTRHLASGTRSCHNGISRSQHAQIYSSALKNMEDNMFFIGLLEHYQVSICVFQSLAFPNDALPRYCDCQDQDAWSSWQQIGHHESHGIKHPSLSSLSSSDLESIDNLTQLDQELYAAAKKRFLQQVEATEHKHQVKLIC
eukprot:TRINITY_DN13882_c1_g1_i1.p1 TRINITY_DN13882_c1_g1~~TRINITY_DN13882_c1_g1_i1.p1  ORF type:complete len:168 (+),score=19.83 TRINITY_DN13882_c1_g1_i1:435-938(+)